MGLKLEKGKNHSSNSLLYFLCSRSGLSNSKIDSEALITVTLAHMHAHICAHTHSFIRCSFIYVHLSHLLSE